jgi:hypothetical protein
MTLNVALCLILALAPVLGSIRVDRRLEGCVDPKTITTLLANMQQADSPGISLEQLRTIWPTELADIECDAKANRSVKSEDRILKGHCECCSVFSFKVRREQGGATSEQLVGATINYSASRRNKLVSLAKDFARASGLGESELKTVGTEVAQSFQWEASKGREPRVYVVEIRFTREVGLWKLYFSTGWYVLEP